ncbi:MAG: class I SAM-dependent methyltransferase [Tannerellaceae bacterium]|nr:class I SAM-dependent methyltransferase [Tannerellaceae bacterium]
MKRNNFGTVAAQAAARLRAINYDALPLSDYNKRYIRAMLPAMEYYMKIFAHCLHRGIRAVALQPAAITLIDYGGGSGFLSILAKEAGFGQVIYIDLNPLSVETIEVLKRQTGAGPDVILQGDAGVLTDYCRAHKVSPHLLIATDLIEHVYDPASFFAALCTINRRMQLIFTTASSPFNPLTKRRLHRFMKDCESGEAVSPHYLARREAFIRRHYPHFSPEQTSLWSRCTRGLTYDDIRKAIDSGSLPLPADPHNTCDPETGNWAERILPLRAYRAFLDPHDYTLSVGKGFYNTRRSLLPFSLICRFLNLLIRYSGPAGLWLSPFIVLWCKPPKENRLE